MELNVWTSTLIDKATYDTGPAGGVWTVEVRRDGRARTLKPRYLILATGHSGGMCGSHDSLLAWYLIKPSHQLTRTLYPKVRRAGSIQRSDLSF